MVDRDVGERGRTGVAASDRTQRGDVGKEGKVIGHASPPGRLVPPPVLLSGLLVPAMSIRAFDRYSSLDTQDSEGGAQL